MKVSSLTVTSHYSPNSGFCIYKLNDSWAGITEIQIDLNETKATIYYAEGDVRIINLHNSIEWSYTPFE